MKRIYITLGFDLSGVVSSVSNLGLDTGDEVVLVAPAVRSERGEEAKRQVENFFEMLRNRGLEFKYRYLELNEVNVLEAVEGLVKDVENGVGDVYFEAVGGVRSLVAAMVVAAFILGGEVKAIHTMAESRGRRVKVYIPPLVVPALDIRDKRILRYLLKNRVSDLTEMSTNLGIPKSSLSRRLRRLREVGLVERNGERPAIYSLTLFGKLVARRQI